MSNLEWLGKNKLVLIYWTPKKYEQGKTCYNKLILDPCTLGEGSGDNKYL